jgi:YVTN family beta-propeller protein
MDPVFRILGPLEVTRDAHFVSLGGRRERAILAILLLSSGEVVSVERLIDGVWGDARPTSAKHMVHEYVSRLRQALGDAPAIATRPPGYLLEWGDPAFDVRVFAERAAAARESAHAGDHAAALRAYDEALSLWRGDALEDVGLEGQAQIAAARLDQERQLASEERVDSALALGRHLQLIPELEHRVEESPLRERPRAQLMLALYRAGRQTEALERYREGRAALVEEAGVEPGRDLRELERAILTQDASLDLAPALPEHEDAPRRVRRARRWKLLAALGAALAVAVVAIVLVAGRSGSAGALASVEANSAGVIDPGRNELVDQVAVGTGPGRVAAGFGSIWVVNAFAGTVSRIDPTTQAVEQTISVDGDPTAIAVGAGFVWVACTGTRSVDRIDPQDNKLVPSILVGNGPSGIAMTPGAVWVTDRLDDTVTEIDANTGRIRRKLPAGPTPSDIVYGLGSLWIANESSGTVTRLDPGTGVRQQIPVGNGPEAIAIGYRSVWVANGLDGTVGRIDPGRNAVTFAYSVGAGPSSILAYAGAIWVADSYGNRIVRIDPATNRIADSIRVGSGPQGLAAIDGRIWLSARETTAAHRGGTLRLFDLNPPDSLDEQWGYISTAWSVFSLTGDGLVGFKRVGGLDGDTLVPDLATALPTPTDGGRTYTFRLRRGIRYSNGEPVRASDVRRGLERWFRLGAQGDGFYDGIVGAGTCTTSRCDLSRGVVANDRAGTVSLHLQKPDPELLYKLALPFADPVPAGVPMGKPTRLGVPGTGPYIIQSRAHNRLVLVRNPRFRQWSAPAQPVGYPDRIVWTFGDALDTQLTDVEHGRADFMHSPLPSSRRNELTTRYEAQVHIFPAAATWAMFLNTRVPPFDNLLARRAVNFAVDRARAVTLFDGAAGPGGFGGVKGAVVTCQIVPPGIVGYRPYCPFTRNPSAAGLWSGPDLAKAQRLVTASGTRGEKVVVWTGPEPLQTIIGRLAFDTLRQLGYRVTLKTIEDDGRFFDKIQNPRTRAQAGFFAWSQDYPAASNFMSLFTCATLQLEREIDINPSDICDRRIDQAVGRALARQIDDGASAATWSGVDRQVTDLAAWVPIVNTRDVAVVSARVNNVQSNPQWGVLFDQIWLR